MGSFPVLAPETFQEQAVRAPNSDYIIPEILDIVRTSPKVYIFSVCPHVIVEGLHVIPACAPGEDVSEPLVLDGYVAEIYDRGEKTKGVNYIPGLQRAMDIIGALSGEPLSEYTSNHEWRGVFISQRPTPTKQQIQNARNKRKEYLLYLVDHGNNLRATEPTAKLQPFHYAAARELNVVTTWADKPKAQASCPYCGAGVSETAAKCPNCREVINLELYQALRARLSPEVPDVPQAAPVGQTQGASDAAAPAAGTAGKPTNKAQH